MVWINKRLYVYPQDLNLFILPWLNQNAILNSNLIKFSLLSTRDWKWYGNLYLRTCVYWDFFLQSFRVSVTEKKLGVSRIPVLSLSDVCDYHNDDSFYQMCMVTITVIVSDRKAFLLLYHLVFIKFSSVFFFSSVYIKNHSVQHRI